MTIYIVSMSTTQGPHGPTVNMWYFKDHQEGLDEFTECKKSLSEDPSTILLVRLDTDTMTEEVWKMYDHLRPGFHTITSGQWGTSEEESKVLLRKEVVKELRRWEKKTDLRPSQVRRVEILKMGLTTI